MSEESVETDEFGITVITKGVEDLPDLLPEFCPSCFMPRDQLIFEIDRAIPGELTLDTRSGLFDFLEWTEDDPIYIYIYGWWCPQCDDKGDHDFDVLYRVVWG